MYYEPTRGGELDLGQLPRRGVLLAVKQRGALLPGALELIITLFDLLQSW